jgi:hypothetical protein
VYRVTREPFVAAEVGARVVGAGFGSASPPEALTFLCAAEGVASAAVAPEAVASADPAEEAVAELGTDGDVTLLAFAVSAAFFAPSPNSLPIRANRAGLAVSGALSCWWLIATADVHNKNKYKKENLN